MSKQSARRKINRLRSCLFNGKPLAIMPSAISPLVDGFESNSLRQIDAAMTFGGLDVESCMKVINGVAIIPVTGVLQDEVNWVVRYGYGSSYQLIERDFSKAISDKQIKSVLYYFDTPGGSAIGCKRVADLTFEARGQKPIHGYVQGMCGSAGFYILAACDRAEATADSLVGSIGTIYPHLEISGLLEEIGYGATVFTNTDSPKKGHGHPYQPLSADAKKTIQDFTNSYGRAFIEDVARYRGITSKQVIDSFGQGDAFRADIAITRGMIDAVVANFSESLKSISGASADAPVEESESNETPVVTGRIFSKEFNMKVSKKIRAQLFALDLIDDPECSDEICMAALRSWFSRIGQKVPSDELAVLNGLRDKTNLRAETDPDDEEEEEEEPEESDTKNKGGKGKPKNKVGQVADNVQQAREAEFSEARLADLRDAADLINKTVGYDAVTANMVLEAFSKKGDDKKPVTVTAAISMWNKSIADKEPTIATNRILPAGVGADSYAKDIVDALVYRACDNKDMKLSDGAAALVSRPLWAVAYECLALAGRKVDMYSNRELLAEQAMEMSGTARHTFYSTQEDRKYIQATGSPSARPGDFPNILSALANKYLDMIELDDDYSYPLVSAVLPGGLNDFKPAMMINKGIVEELDEVQDAEKFKELGLQEEVLSYIFLRRFGNAWGWTPVMIANDDLNAFAEGMIGLESAWQVTQNRLVVGRYTSTENLLDGNPLFADRANTGSGTNPALNKNLIDSGGSTPSDAQWGLMEAAYADIGGINTGRRVRGTLNVAFVPTGPCSQEARRTFATLNTGGLEMKVANTTSNVGLYRGEVSIVPESELRVASTKKWIGLRSPTKLNTATVVRGYFNGFGTAGRRERWYDPTNKTTWTSLEGRIAVAVKNWRYAIENKGEA